MESTEREHLRDREVRLFPSAHISSVREAELRAASSLLAMTKAVDEFGRVVTRAAGAPKGQLSCFVEVPFKVEGPAGPRAIRPDGVITVTRGKREWSALLELKVGDNPLNQDQFNEYHRLASSLNLDALITVSNEPALPNGQPPLAIDGRRARRVPVTHFSWDRLLSEARLLSRKKLVQDPDQAWMLREWTRYVADPDSRIIRPPDFGPQWHDVVALAREGKLSSAPVKVQSVVERWHGFVRKAGMRLRAELGAEVTPRVSRAHRNNPAAYLKAETDTTVDRGSLKARFRVAGAAGDVYLEVLLASRMARCGISVDSPDKGRALTRIRWIVRQLRKLEDPPSETTITALWDQRGLESRSSLSEAVKDEAALLRDVGSQMVPREARPKRFRIETTARLKKARGRASAAVAEGVYALFEEFYGRVVQDLTPYIPKAPQLPEPAKQVATANALVPVSSPLDVVRDAQDASRGVLGSSGSGAG